MSDEQSFNLHHQFTLPSSTGGTFPARTFASDQFVTPLFQNEATLEFDVDVSALKDANMQFAAELVYPGGCTSNEKTSTYYCDVINTGNNGACLEIDLLETCGNAVMSSGMHTCNPGPGVGHLPCCTDYDSTTQTWKGCDNEPDSKSACWDCQGGFESSTGNVQGWSFAKQPKQACPQLDTTRQFTVRTQFKKDGTMETSYVQDEKVLCNFPSGPSGKSGDVMLNVEEQLHPVLMVSLFSGSATKFGCYKDCQKIAASLCHTDRHVTVGKFSCTYPTEDGTRRQCETQTTRFTDAKPCTNDIPQSTDSFCCDWSDSVNSATNWEVCKSQCSKRVPKGEGCRPDMTNYIPLDNHKRDDEHSSFAQKIYDGKNPKPFCINFPH